MNTAVIGAGNIGTALAVLLSEQGHRVRVLTSRPKEVSKEPVLTDDEGRILHRGCGIEAFDDPVQALKDAELTFFTVPAFLSEVMKERIEGLLKPGSVLCFVPGNGGFELVFRKEQERGVALCALERVPMIARAEVYGTRVRIGKLRDELHAAALDPAMTPVSCGRIEEALSIPVRALPNYLNLTLTPSNPILHTSRLYSLFRDYKAGMTYPSLPYFYEDWDEESAELLLAMDDELMNTVKALPELSLNGVNSLRTHYESKNKTELKEKLSSIPAFRGIKTPMVETEKGFLPDFSSRYFASDFPYGLKILLETAVLSGTACPCMKRIYGWYKNIAAPAKEFSFAEYGIRNRNDLVDFYGNNASLH